MKLTEGLDFQDLRGQIENTVSVDEYAAKIGEDSEIVTVAFVVNSKLAAQDLVSWLETGYNFILDASVSEGQLKPGKWLVFVEMRRKGSVPRKIIKMLEDLETLTEMKISDWAISVDDHEYDPDPEVLKQVILLTPADYRIKKESANELNEMRTIAGLDIKPIYENVDEEIRKYLTIAGL